MNRSYLGITVYDALIRRLHFIFREFENIYVAFSGGKDSGLLLQVLLDFRNSHYPNRRIGVFHQDFEAQYTVTTKFIDETFKKLKSQKNIDCFWVCLPMASRTALSNYEMFWYPWDDEKKDIWVREIPNYDYVIRLENNPISSYRYKMHQEDLAKQFGKWYKDSHGGAKTVCLLGTRADESLQRYSGFVNKKYAYKDQCWITKQFTNVWTASPIYDWSVEDVWHANYKFGYAYNELYDLYHKAGLNPSQMRVASPFQDYAVESLNLYRVIDPDVWARLLGRVQGVNFGSIYGRTKAMAYRNLSLPKGHTWKSYTQFLLVTLPPRIRNNYIRKFNKSIYFWHHVGGGLEEIVINELIEKGYRIKRNGVSNYTIFKDSRIIFLDNIPDNTDDIRTTKGIPSWKRMCFCILKNDHICRFMGFGLTREQQKKLDQIKKKYIHLEEMKQDEI